MADDDQNRTTEEDPLLDAIRSRDWFYEFELPDGHRTKCYLPDHVAAIHDTRLRMLKHILRPLFSQANYTALDLACHQGWFAMQLAKWGCKQVTGIDARASHVEDARLMAKALRMENVRFLQCDIESMSREQLDGADIVLMLGLIYHLENPVGAIRKAHAFCRHVCLIETQVGPHLSGNLDWGSYEFVRPIQGCFTVIDESQETHGPEASTKGICLAPSAETLLWVMRKVGFKNVSIVAPPEDAYEQLAHGKRVLAVGYV